MEIVEPPSASPEPARRKSKAPGAASVALARHADARALAADPPLRKPVNALAIVPQSRKITPLFRKSYNVMLFLAQEQGIEREIYRAPVSAVLAGIDFDSNDTEIVKRHLRAMATTAVEWQSPTKGEGGGWAISGLIGHAEIKRERGQNWLEWSYSVKLKQELLEPSVFARLSIEIISQLRTHGGIALYEICSRYKDVGRSSRQAWTWWRPVLSGKPETEKQKLLEYRFFKRDVLKPAIAEVNAITDLEVELVEFKQGKFIAELQFVIRKKAQSSLPLQHPPKPLDLSLVTRAKALGIDDERGERLLAEFGDEALRSGLDALDKRISSAYPEPLRDHYRYLKSLMPGEAARVAKREESDKAAASGPKAADVHAKRQARWTEEWLRRRREKVFDDIAAMSPEEQQALSSALLENMEARNVHPSIRKRLRTSGWQHAMVRSEMLRFYAEAAIGDGWDKPTPVELLQIAAQLGDDKTDSA
ncbi:MAG: replication initiation protein [Burkholderiales bacterium]|nr:replication initiation protein [Burkholderiales bacterium]